MAVAFLSKYQALVEQTDTIKYIGRVTGVRGLTVTSHGPRARVGELCRIVAERADREVLAEVVGLTGHSVQLAPFSDIEGVEIGDAIIGTGAGLRVPVGFELLGRVIDACGEPIDGGPTLAALPTYPASADPPHVLTRSAITDQVQTGVRAIDALVPVGKGQRLGIFSGSGVGKSTLIGMIARNTAADINVIALIGERGREVREFIENELGPEGLERSVLVVSTSNTPAMARLRGAFAATAIAEYFRDQGQDVMLMFDSVTRFARAQREIGLSRGEGPASRGFPPSVDAVLPQLLERCGTSEHGTITGFYTVLVEGDDLDEPVSDAVRGILDGHLVLSRNLATRGHYPAIDVLESVSRLESSISTTAQRSAAREVRRLMAVYRDAEDLINAGVYQSGSNPEIDLAIRMRESINAMLRQQIAESSSLEDTIVQLTELVGAEPDA